MSRDIYDQAHFHFAERGERYEYGRPDGTTTLRNGNVTDRSRNEQDLDGDGLRGVDCSSLVWRGLKNAGYDVGTEPFNTHALYSGNTITDYSKKHFDVISAADAAKHPGDLQPGDILMLKAKHGGNQHVAIFQGYDKDGNIEFYGSQTSTGPAKVTMTENNYFRTNMEIVGALRAKPEFRTHEPVAIPGQPNEPARTKPAPSHVPAATHAASAPHGEVLRKGDHDSTDVRKVQDALKHLGYHDERGRALVPDGNFGDHTKAAVERFQKDHGLEVDGVVGKHTLDAIHAAERQGPRLDNAAHADNGLFRQAQAAVHKMDAEQGRTPDHVSDRLAAAGTVAARKEGMTGVDSAVLNQDGSKAYFVQGDMNSPFKRLAEVNTQQAINTSMEQSSAQLKQTHEQQAAVQPIQPQHQQAPTQPASPPAPGL
jgi:peptidoglycan hydrolase-like protein with peptidoglycan-binding domain